MSIDRLYQEPGTPSIDVVGNAITDESGSENPTLNSENLVQQDESSKSKLDWLRKHQLKLALGGLATSGVVALANDFNTTKHQLIEAAPWMATSLAASEVAWIGGAAMMLAGVGAKIGNPLKIRSRMLEIAKKANDSKTFKAGFIVNASAAVGQFGILTAGITTELPPKSWGLLAVPAMDIASTLAIRDVIWQGMKRNSQVINSVEELEAPTDEQVISPDSTYEDPLTSSLEINEPEPKVKVRNAVFEDVPRLAEIDLQRYKRVYGQTPPTTEEVEAMFTERLTNATPEWMFVCEVDGQVEGFVTGFRTNKPIEEFISWEESTANGTLKDKVDPDGRYGYIANLTVNPVATKLGGEDMLMVNLLAKAVKEGLEYGYFISRIPVFAAHLKRNIRQRGLSEADLTPHMIDQFANEYVRSREIVDGKEVATDYELRMYEEAGFQMGRLVKDAFQDPQSHDYGVLFTTPIPPNNKVLKQIKPLRSTMASVLRFASKHPKLLNKIV